MKSILVQNSDSFVSKYKGALYNKQNLLIILCGLLLPIMSIALGANIFFDLLIVLLFAFILITTKIDGAVVFYSYIVFFSHLFRSFGITIVALLGIVLSILILVKHSNCISNHLFAMFFVSFYSLVSIILTSDFASMALVYSIVIAFYIRDKILSDNHNFIKEIFLSIFIAAIISTICGFTNYIGLGSRFSIPLGIDSACMLLVGGMIYPIFYFKRAFYKFVAIVFLLIPLFLTVSITAIICLSVFTLFIILYSLFSKNSKMRRSHKFYLIFILLLFLVLFIFVWNYGCGIVAIDNLIERIKTVIEQIGNGDLNKATTGRYDIYTMYINYFNSFPMFQRLFGGGRMSYYGLAYYRNYSHNTFLDSLMFFGIIPLSLVIVFLIDSFLSIKKSECAFKIFLLKSVFLITSMSVSLLSGGYWLLFILI